MNKLILNNYVHVELIQVDPVALLIQVNPILTFPSKTMCIINFLF